MMEGYVTICLLNCLFSIAEQKAQVKMSGNCLGSLIHPSLLSLSVIFSKSYVSRANVIEFHAEHHQVGERWYMVLGLIELELRLPWVMVIAA